MNQPVPTGTGGHTWQQNRREPPLPISVTGGINFFHHYVGVYMNEDTKNTRGRFDEILLSTVNPKTMKRVNKLINEAAAGAHVDEHGAWEFGADIDRKRRGVALNWDLYGYGLDFHSGRMLAVIQVRQYHKQCAGWWPSIRKNYFLIGSNEDGTVFAHAVQSAVVRSAIRRDRPVIRAVQDWLWDADYSKVVRQGDIGLIPRRSKPKGESIDDSVTVEGSHHLSAAEILRDGKHLYALNPAMVHVPGTHPSVSAVGWYRVASAKRAPTWDFAAATVD